MRIRTIEEMRERVKNQIEEIQELSKIPLAEFDNDKFVLSVIGYCTEIRMELDVLRNDVLAFKQLQGK